MLRVGTLPRLCQLGSALSPRAGPQTAASGGLSSLRARLRGSEPVLPVLCNSRHVCERAGGTWTSLIWLNQITLNKPSPRPDLPLRLGCGDRVSYSRGPCLPRGLINEGPGRRCSPPWRARAAAGRGDGPHDTEGGGRAAEEVPARPHGPVLTRSPGKRSRSRETRGAGLGIVPLPPSLFQTK